MAQTWKYQDRGGEQFFFLHIPKTAGTTFRKLLETHFLQAHIYPNRFQLWMNDNKYYKQKHLIENRVDILNTTLISGHYNIHLLPHLKKEVRAIAFVREPRARVISHIKHILLKDPVFKNADPNLVVEKRVEILAKQQVRMMGYNIRKENNLDQALANLDKIEVIGLTEKFEQSIDMINKKFGWQLDYKMEKANQSITPDFELSAESEARLAENIKEEQMLYDACLKKFEKQKQF